MELTKEKPIRLYNKFKTKGLCKDLLSTVSKRKQGQNERL